MIVFRAIVWAEDRREWEKDEVQNTVGVYVSNDQRAFAAGSIEHLLLRVQKHSAEISTDRESMRLAYSFNIDRQDKAQPVTTKQPTSLTSAAIT